MHAGGGHNICFVETQPKSDEWDGHPIYAAADAGKLDVDEFHIANTHVRETVQALLSAGIEKERIVITVPEVYNIDTFAWKVLQEPQIRREDEVDSGLVLTRSMTYTDGVPCVEHVQMGHGSLSVSNDYVRYGTLRLLAQEIQEESELVGDVAELGVFRGDFSRCINELFPERKLWLFDTFDGFSEENLSEKEKIQGFQGGRFSNTSVDLVLAKMPHAERCKIRKGLFPETIPEEEISYAFVSIDCDLYEPALEGLRYFYANLVPGGYIMLHDCVSKLYRGIREAVHAYEKENGHVIKVPMPDEAGTVVIQKPFA